MSSNSDIFGNFVPRLIRLKDAPFYVGMGRNRFNVEVRPDIVEIRIGKQGVAFDRLDLDAWVDQYKARNGRPAGPRGTPDIRRRGRAADKTDFSKTTNRSEEYAFEQALARTTSRRRGNAS